MKQATDISRTLIVNRLDHIPALCELRVSLSLLKNFARWSCVTLLLALQSGCAFFPALNGGCRSMCQLPPGESERLEMLAQNAWAECVAKNPQLVASDYYEQGFRDGFINKLTSKSTSSWKSGYRHGAWQALRYGIRPMSTAMIPTPLAGPNCSAVPIFDNTCVERTDAGGAMQHASSLPYNDSTSPNTPPSANPFDSMELEPESQYHFDPEQGITNDPSTIEVEPDLALPSEVDGQPYPTPYDAEPRRTTQPKSNSKLQKSQQPAFSDDLELAPEQMDESTDPFPADDANIDDDLDLLSPFGNQIPPPESGGTAESRGMEPAGDDRESGGSSDEDLNFDDDSEPNSEGFELQIHDASESDEIDSDDQARDWLNDERRRSRKSAVSSPSYYERSVTSTSGHRAKGDKSIEESETDTSNDSVQPASFFGTATSNPTRRLGSLNGEMPIVPLKKKVWYFDQDSDKAGDR